MNNAARVHCHQAGPYVLIMLAQASALSSAVTAPHLHVLTLADAHIHRPVATSTVNIL